MAILNWALSPRDSALVNQIAERVMRLPNSARLTTHEVLMDLTACHNHGCPLDLAGLLDAEPGDFSHDVYGIIQYLDRGSGKLTDCFTPRYRAEAKGDTGG